MKTTCKCGNVDDYNGKSGRKVCTKCGHKYKVTPKTHPTAVNQQNQSIKERFFLSELDVLILGILKSVIPNGKYQSQLAKATKFSPSTISRRLKKLEQKGIIVQELASYPKIWKLNEEKDWVDTHAHRFTCKILHGTPKVLTKKKIQMTNWVKKIFEIWLPRERIWVKNAELNTSSIVFSLQVSEEDTDLAEAKAKDYAFFVKQHLEKKYKIKLAHPFYHKLEGKVPFHAIQMRGGGMVDRDIDPKGSDIACEVYVDKSPFKDGTVETPVRANQHKAWYDHQVETSNYLQQQIKEINTKMGQMNEKIVEGFKAIAQSVGDMMGKLVKNLTTLPENIAKNIKTNQQPEVKEQDEEEKEPSNIYL